MNTNETERDAPYDRACRDPLDNCPTEGAVLKREWRDFVTPPQANEAGRLRAGMHMPRWASRITLEVTGVRVERLQTISNDDIKAEGLDDDPRIVSGEIEGSMLTPVGRLIAFQDLWESINGSGSWEANPWVWVVEFKRIDAAMKGAR